mmetsp:Transcript_17965/g.36823  ORF Transcript_17965/g.36823 Transcript_17965/m.36823 type:complete len:99 (-) Transcript_17965:786-1082(-)
MFMNWYSFLSHLGSPPARRRTRNESSGLEPLVHTLIFHSCHVVCIPKISHVHLDLRISRRETSIHRCIPPPEGFDSRRTKMVISNNILTYRVRIGSRV